MTSEILRLLVENAPFLVVITYSILLLLLFLSSAFRHNFSDSHKHNTLNSWIRYMGSFVVISAVVIALAQVAGNKEINYAVVTTMLTIAFGGKVAQKHVENKNIISEVTITEEEVSEKIEETS